MNSQQFGYYLKSFREYLGFSDKRISYYLPFYDVIRIESGQKCSFKTFYTYLNAMGLGLGFRINKEDMGCIKIFENKINIYSSKFNKDLGDVLMTDTFDLLRYFNKNEMSFTFRVENAIVKCPNIDYKNKDIWSRIKHINNKLRSLILINGISMDALANKLKIKTSSLENFLYGVVNYDFTLYIHICNMVGKVPVVFSPNLKFNLVIRNNRIVGAEYSELVGLKEPFDLNEYKSNKIEDVIASLISMKFTKVILASDATSSTNIVETIMMENVDNKGKMPFHMYTKSELEDIVKWRKTGYAVNETCDVCLSRNLTCMLYSTKDDRVIQICKCCKDKIHPTNNYVNIIYTPTGGQNRKK